MKRSLVIDRLRDKIEFCSCADAQTLATVLLDEIEALGMLPPGMFIDMVQGKPLVEHVWEEEND